MTTLASKVTEFLDLKNAATGNILTLTLESTISRMKIVEKLSVQAGMGNQSLSLSLPLSGCRWYGEHVQRPLLLYHSTFR
jgi:hypothetical protein